MIQRYEMELKEKDNYLRSELSKKEAEVRDLQRVIQERDAEIARLRGSAAAHVWMPLLMHAGGGNCRSSFLSFISSSLNFIFWMENIHTFSFLSISFQFRLSHRFSFFLLAVAYLSPAEETEEEGKGEGRGEGRGLYDLVGVLVEY